MGERAGGVWRGRRDSGVPDDDEAEPGSVRRVGRGWGLTGLFAVAISGLVLYLVWCVLWERSHPAGGAARAVRAAEVAERLRAVADLERLGPEDPDVVFPALIAALDDPDADVRAAAAPALVTVIQGTGVGGAYPQQVGDAVKILLGRTKDTQAVVRASAGQALWMIVLLWQGAARLIDLGVIADVQDEAARDPDAGVRLSGVRGLGVIGQRLSDDPPPRLVAALEDPSEVVRAAAAQSLALFPRGLIRLLPALREIDGECPRRVPTGVCERAEADRSAPVPIRENPGEGCDRGAAPGPGQPGSRGPPPYRHLPRRIRSPGS